MARRETSGEIDDDAATWATRVERGGLTADEQAALDAWLASDVRHLGAFTKAQAVLALFDRAKALGPGGLDRLSAANPRAPLITRRTALLAGSGALAASVAGLVGGGMWWRARHPLYATKRGEVRTIALADGSTMTLDTSSRAGVRLDDHLREIELESGQGLFDVAKDPARPFVVKAGLVSVRAIGTSFSVQHLDDATVHVLVREGVVQVSHGTDARTVAPRRLSANQAAIVSTAAPIQVETRNPATVERMLAWREGMIDLEVVSLGEAAGQFARFSDYAVVPDRDVADLKITGRFSAADPKGFAKAAAASLDLKADFGPDAVTLHR